MPIVERSRELDAAPERVWALLEDVRRQADWWPRCERVETDPARPDAFTQLLRTKKGRTLRAEQSIIERVEGSELTWAMRLRGTPFENVFEAAQVTALVQPAGAGAKLTLVQRQKMRGVDRLGGHMAARAARKTLDAALTGVERVLGD